MGRYPPTAIAVAVADDVERTSTVRLAAWMSTRHRAPLQILHVYQLPAYAGMPWAAAAQAEDAVRSTARSVVVAATALARAQGAEVNGSSLVGDATEILEDVSKLVDMVVMGAPATDHEDTVKAAHLTMRSSCPVVMVPPEPRTGGLVAVVVGRGELPDDLLGLGTDVAAAMGATLRVVPRDGADTLDDLVGTLAGHCAALVIAIDPDNFPLAIATADAARRHRAVVIAVPPATLR